MPIRSGQVRSKYLTAHSEQAVVAHAGSSVWNRKKGRVGGGGGVRGDHTKQTKCLEENPSLTYVLIED